MSYKLPPLPAPENRGTPMVDEQQLRELAGAATPGPWMPSMDGVVTRPEHGPSRVVLSANVMDDQRAKDCSFVSALHPTTILTLLDELQTLRSERTAWQVTAENAEEKKTQLQEFSKLACRALDDCSRVLSTIEDEIDYDEVDRIKELDSRVSSLAVQALVLNGLTHGGQLDEAIDASLKAAVKQAREDALEEAKQACEAISVDRWSLYKGRAPYTGKESGRADPDTQGQSDGADACAAAIESLKGKP